MNNRILYKLWCEYDIYEDSVVFESEDDAFKWAKEILKNYSDVEPFDELLKGGLIGTKTIELVTYL